MAIQKRTPALDVVCNLWLASWFVGPEGGLVFRIYGNRQLPTQTRAPAQLSSLARMENSADIWGPV